MGALDRPRAKRVAREVQVRWSRRPWAEVWIEAAELVSVVSAVGKGIGVGRVGTGVGRGAI